MPDGALHIGSIANRTATPCLSVEWYNQSTNTELRRASARLCVSDNVWAAGAFPEEFESEEPIGPEGAGWRGDSDLMSTSKIRGSSIRFLAPVSPSR